MSTLLDEIRINPRHTQYLSSVFENGTELESEAKIRKSVTTTSQYLSKLSQGLSFFQGIIPSNCRYIEKISRGTLVVIEEPPQYHTISVNYPMDHELDLLRSDNKIEEWGIDENYYKNHGNMPWKFNLAFPYVIHMLLFDKYDQLTSGQAFLRNARLSGFSDYLLKMPMMNISSDGYICYGDKGNTKGNSLASSIDNIVSVFWSATFNSDYTYNYTAYKNVAGVNTYIGWQALSHIDPMFIYNVEWIKQSRNIIEEIKRMKEHHDGRSTNTIGYDSLSKVFTQPADSGIEEQIKRGSGSKRTSRLYYDIAQGIYLDDKFFFHVGDPIKWGRHTAYVDSFIGFFESDSIRLIRLELDNGKFITTRFNNKVKQYMYRTAKYMRFDEHGTLKNGIVIKPEDIIKIKSGSQHIYRKVHFIRKARDGVTEARMGDTFYILENTEGELLNVESPKYGDININKEDVYIFVNGVGSGPFHNGCEVKFSEMDITRYGSLKMNFISTDQKLGRDQTSELNMEDKDRYQRLYKREECKSMPGIFRVGRKLMCLKLKGEIVENLAWGTPEGIIYNGIYEATSPTINEVEQRLISDDGTVFHIESHDLDITFKIGDKVVYADWTNPINMLIVRTITAFKIDKDTSSIDFILSDKDGRLTQVNYVSGQNIRSVSRAKATTINVGRIRKITNHFGRVTAGTKIIATKGYIPHFPKKDVNIIIGFITDTGGDDPLVLCSNCCTLWYSEMMENFKRVTMKSKKWPELAHAPIDITKIKPQPGDIVNGTTELKSDGGWLVIRNLDHKVPKIVSLRYTTYSDLYSMDTYTRNHVQFDCIPNPRISPTDQGKAMIYNAWPNFHGLFIESKVSQIKFLEDGRSLLHVSDLHK
jgi:hypothetical protein